MITVTNQVIGGQGAAQSNANHDQSSVILLFQIYNHLLQVVGRIVLDRFGYWK